MSMTNQPRKKDQGVEMELASLACGWILWHFGHPDKHLQPYKDLNPRDFSERQDREMLSNLGFLVRSFHRHVSHQIQSLHSSDPVQSDQQRLQFENFVKNPRPEEAQRIYQRYEKSFLEWIQNDETYRMRRNQLEWNTFIQEPRHYKKYKHN
eukprot:768795-Hanusia_phi.AAC.4